MNQAETVLIISRGMEKHPQMSSDYVGFLLSHSKLKILFEQDFKQNNDNR